jgi:tetratricopeptide (TPR) repeat protein
MLYYYAAPSLIGGDKKKAQQLAETMTTVDAGRGYLAQARLAHEMKDQAKEEDFYKKSIDANPQFYDSKAALAGFYLNLPNPDQASAENYACDALAADPGRAEAWKALAEIRVASQCWTELDNLLPLAEQFDPDDLAPYYSAATAMLRTSAQLEMAEAYLRKYVAAPVEANEPSLGSAHWQLGAILEKLERQDDAIAALAQAVDEEPTLDAAKKDLKRLRKNN